MKKTRIVSRSNGFREPLIVISRCAILFVGIYIFNVFTSVYLKEYDNISRCLTQLIFVPIISWATIKLGSNGFYKTCNFKITDNWLYLKIESDIMAKFTWANIREIYMDEKYCNVIHIHVEYTLQELPREKKRLSEKGVDVLDKSLLRPDLVTILTSSRKGNRDEIFNKILDAKLKNQHRFKTRQRHIKTFDTSAISLRNILYYCIIALPFILFIG